MIQFNYFSIKQCMIENDDQTENGDCNLMKNVHKNEGSWEHIHKQTDFDFSQVITFPCMRAKLSERISRQLKAFPFSAVICFSCCCSCGLLLLYSVINWQQSAVMKRSSQMLRNHSTHTHNNKISSEARKPNHTHTPAASVLSFFLVDEIENNLLFLSFLLQTLLFVLDYKKTFLIVILINIYLYFSSLLAIYLWIICGFY